MEILTIEEAIAFCHEKSNNIKLKAEPQVFIQLGELLEELKKRRSEDYGYMADIHQSIGYRKAIDDLDGIESLKSNKGFGGTIQTMYADGMLDKAKEIVREVAEEYNNGWIPCSERLPEECTEVLVSVKEIDGSFYTRTSWVQDGVWVIKKTPLQPTVIAWQPLPEPYKERD